MDLSNFVLGNTYTFKHDDGTTFIGKLINRKYELGLAFNGKVVGENKGGHLPLYRVVGKDTKWEVINNGKA